MFVSIILYFERFILPLLATITTVEILAGEVADVPLSHASSKICDITVNQRKSWKLFVDKSI